VAARATRPREPIERLLSKWRIASRTEAGRLVRAGRVRVNGAAVLDPRRVVDPERDRVEVDGRAASPPAAGTTWLAMNKPRGVVVTTKDPEGRRTVMDLLGPRAAAGVAPVGRLDKASAGLLLLTDDAGLADRLLDPRTHLAKRYRVKVRGRPGDEALRRLREDTLVEDGLVLGPMEVEVESLGPRSAWLLVTLREGKNRQIRRRLLDVGLEVEVLVRTAVGPLALGDLAPGAVRALAPAEVAALRAAAARGARAP
jgi:23S rRNA pseudouridine2605 synthase